MSETGHRVMISLCCLCIHVLWGQKICLVKLWQMNMRDSLVESNRNFIGPDHRYISLSSFTSAADSKLHSPQFSSDALGIKIQWRIIPNFCFMCSSLVLKQYSSIDVLCGSTLVVVMIQYHWVVSHSLRDRISNSVSKRWCTTALSTTQGAVDDRKQRLDDSEIGQQYLFDAAEAEAFMGEQELFLMSDERAKVSVSLLCTVSGSPGRHT